MTFTATHTAVIYALISAFLFALTNHLQSIGLDGADARSGSLVNIATGAVAYWLISPWFLEGWYWLSWGALWFALVGLIRPSMSSALALSSIKAMGPTLTSALTATAPLFGAMYAIALLGEQLDARITLGTLAIVAGAMLAAWRPQGMTRHWPLWALLLPLGAALVRATGHAGTKLGLAVVPSPSFAVMVGNSVSLVVAVIAFRLEGRRFTGAPRNHKWFVMAGLAAALSLHFLNSALEIGNLTSVVPIVAASPVFTMLLGLLVFRREVFSWRTALTIALVVPGVVLIALHKA